MQHRNHTSHGEPRAFGHRGRRRRIFEAGELQLLILGLIAEDARHGYELIREIETRSGGVYAPSPGMVYPTLSFLVETGLIEEADGGGARKSFAVTEAGRAHLDTNADALKAAMARLAALEKSRDRAEPAPLRRAIANLRQVLNGAVEKPGFSEDKALEAARLIDEAAGRIERL